MENVQFRNYQMDDAAAMSSIQSRCLEISPDTGKFDPGFWSSPMFEQGRNIFIATNPTREILGYAAICSSYHSLMLDARILWIDLRANPAFENPEKLKNVLLKRIIDRGREIKAELGLGRAALGATYFSEGTISIEYLKSRGFQHFESSLAMHRNLLDIPVIELPHDVEIWPSRLEKQTEQDAYVTARELAFGYSLGCSGDLSYFMQSDLWQDGTAINAYVPDMLIGSVMALSNGLLDYIFVVPDWRGKGIAMGVVTQALRFLKAQKHTQAWLEVLSHNQAAVGLYQKLGFETFKEEISLGYLLD